MRYWSESTLSGIGLSSPIGGDADPFRCAPIETTDFMDEFKEQTLTKPTSVAKNGAN